MAGHWVALHIFYNGDLDLLLARCIRPGLSTLRQTGALRRYFFVRYWNGGPHIRLRMDISPDDKTATDQMKAHIGRFLVENPGGSLPAAAYADQIAPMRRASARFKRQYHRDPETAEPVQPGDSVQIRAYDFDVERYGGLMTREVIEAHFCRSSELALLIVAQTLGNLPARASLALHLAAAAVDALDLGVDDATRLFRRMSSEILNPFCDYPDNGDRRSSGFPSFEEQESELGDLLFQLRHPFLGLPSQKADVNKLLQDWRHELSLRCRQLLEHHIAGELPCKPRYIVMDFLHMLNNRLGVDLFNECYLYHLISGALQAVESAARQDVRHRDQPVFADACTIVPKRNEHR